MKRFCDPADVERLVSAVEAKEVLIFGETHNRCLHCNEPILASENHIGAAHIECMVYISIGSVPHQMKECSCFGGSAQLPRNTSLRQDAIAAFEMFKKGRAKVRSSRYN